MKSIDVKSLDITTVGRLIGVGCVALFVGALGGYASRPAAPITTTPLSAPSNPTATVTVQGTSTVTLPASTVTLHVPVTDGPTVTVTAAAAVAAAPPPAAGTTIEDGQWSVGPDKDVKPGVYKSAGVPADSFGCYWEITKTGSTGGLPIANDIVKGGRPTVTLKAGQDFKSQSCGTWEKVG